MGTLMFPGMLAAVLAPEPSSDKRPHLPHTGFAATIWAPIRDLLTRLGPNALAILLLVAGFRMPGYIASAMAVPLFKHQGFSNTDIATVTKLFGFWIALGGTFMAGFLIPRIGMLPNLLIGTVAGSASHVSLAYLAAHGGNGGTAFWTFAITGAGASSASATCLFRESSHTPSNRCLRFERRVAATPATRPRPAC